MADDEQKLKVSDHIPFSKLLVTKQTLPLRLYGKEPSTKPNQIYSVNDILERVASEVAIMRNADAVSDTARKNVRSCNKSSALAPLTSFASLMDNTSRRKETQCVTDTEMMDAADGAEAVLQMIDNKGMTQMFNVSNNNTIKIDREIHRNCNSGDGETYNIDKKKYNTTQSDTCDIPEYKQENVQDNETKTGRVDKIGCKMYRNEQQNIHNIYSKTPLGNSYYNIVCEDNDIEQKKYKEMPAEEDNIKENDIKLIVSESHLKNYDQILEEKALKMYEHYIFRPPSPILIPTIKFMDSPVKENKKSLKWKDFSLEEFEKLETSLNKMFKSQHYRLQDEDLEECERISQDLITMDCSQKVINIFNDNIDDDIVFSSDEECSYSKPQAMPVDPVPAVFDKSVYGANINKVSLEQLEKLKENFENITEGKYTSELLEISKTNILTEHKERSDDLKLNTEEEFDNALEDLSKEPGPCTKFQGFSTASNKKIKVSKKALVTSKRLFQDIEDVLIDNDFSEDEINKPGPLTTFQGFTTASNEKIKVSKEALATTKALFQDIEDFPIHSDFRKDEIYKPAPSTIFKGFKTASNQNIKVSKEAFAKTKRLFQDIAEITTETDVIEEEKYEAGPSTKFQGFTSASNKNNKIPKEALAKTKRIFQDIEDNRMDNYFVEDDVNKTGPPTTFQVFTTASNKKIKVSKEALATTKRLFQDIEDVPIDNYFREDEINKPGPSTTFQGFTTASNKKIKISKEALDITKKLFQHIEDVPIENYFSEDEINKPGPSTTFQGFTITEGKDNSELLEISKTNALIEHQERRDDLKQNTEEEFDNAFEDLSKKPSTKFQGFITASNKKIKVSKEALGATKALFQDIEDVPMDNNLNEDEINKRGPSTTFQGFTTANNKKINVSKEALATTKTLFQDIEDVPIDSDFREDEIYKPGPSTVFKGFTTASNKNIKVSKEALAKTKRLFQNIEEISTETGIIEEKKYDAGLSTTFQGFTTASNENIEVSKDALTKTEKLFQDIEEIPTENEYKEDDIEKGGPSTKFKGFTTASNKNIKVSEEALVKTKNIFQEFIEDFSKMDTTASKFEGLATASNNKIKISDKTLTKSKTLFQNLDDTKTECAFLGIKTGNNKNIKVSEKALEKTQNIFQDLNIVGEISTYDPEGKNHKEIATSKICQEDSENKKPTIKEKNYQLMDTQIKNHFEETMYTEDFCKPQDVELVRNKKSGSPILPFSTAKRRKIQVFKVPYRIDSKIDSCIKNYVKEVKKDPPSFVYKFNDDYKVNSERISLNNLKFAENTEIQQNTVPKFDFDNPSAYKFLTNDLTDTDLSFEALKTIFLNSVDRKIVPEGWLDNHIKLILWKLLSYETNFPECLFGVATPKNVLQQLKYRYDRELYRAERPALRKILERDETAGRCMVLSVVRILAGGDVEDVANTTNVELEVTDGWYCVRATIDKLLCKAVADGRIVSGTKLITHGAELMNCDQGVAPWEDTTLVRLKLAGNSTRRAAWHARLGLRRGAAPRASLRTVTPDGGRVSLVRVMVARLYPMLFVERLRSGDTVTRSERLECLHASAHESERQARLERIYVEVEGEMSQEQRGAGRGTEGAAGGTEEAVTESQRCEIDRDAARQREQMLENVQKRIAEKIEEMGLNEIQRNVVPLLKARVCSWRFRDHCAGSRGSPDENRIVKTTRVGAREVEMTIASLSVWKPSENLLDVLKEGVWVDAMNVVPTAVRMNELQISAGRQSVFNKVRSEDVENLSAYAASVARRCTTLREIRNTSDRIFNEVDLVGFVLQIDPDMSDFEKTPMRNQHFQNVYLSDVEKNFVCIHFWGGLKKFGYDKVIEPMQFISCSNLQKRMGNSRKTIPQFRVTEFSIFTKVPRNQNCSAALDALKKDFENVDLDSFCRKCIDIKDKYSIVRNNYENESPYRLNRTEFNISKHKMFIDSPDQHQNKIDGNLTGLDFDSTFKLDSQLNEKEALRKSKIRSRIEKLKRYGEPPPLSPINITNKSSKVDSSFKSPILDRSNSVTSVKNSNSIDKENKMADESPNGNVVSPILHSSKEIKRVNPVKLNFSSDSTENIDETEVVTNNIMNNENHFAEEFDYSPPLSLDANCM